MECPKCAYCKRLKRADQLMETQSGKLICVMCAEEFHMCEVCGATTKENYSPHGLVHFDDMCFQ